MLQQALVDRIKAIQKEDLGIVKLVEEIEKWGKPEFSISKDEILRFRGRLCVLNSNDIKRVILEKAHCSLYSLPSEYQNLSRYESFL